MMSMAGETLSTLDHSAKADSATIKGILEGLKATETKAHRYDTSIGGCVVFNPYYQACRFDDPVFPINQTSDTGVGVFDIDGYGSIYAEAIADKQKILWLSFGTPVFCGLSSFFESGSPDLARTVKNGRLSIAGTIGSALAMLPGFMFKMYFWPITLSNMVADIITDRTTITRYFDFRESMLLYYKYVNYVLGYLAVALGFKFSTDLLNDTAANKEYSKRIAEDDDVPMVAKEHSDIFTIINSRYRKTTEGRDSDFLRKSTDDLFAEDDGGDLDGEAETFLTTAWKEFETGFKAGVRGSNRYIGFRIEKSSSANESLSNNTGPPTIVNSLNALSQSVKDTTFSMQEGQLFDNASWMGNMVNGALGALKDFGTSAATTIADTIGAGGAVQIATGNGQYDIPDMYMGSQFTKSQSFTIRLSTLFGNVYSIYQDLYIPYALLFAGAAPRTIGFNMYASPFLCQAFVRGLFSTTLGMITDFDITRGDSELGWNMTHLPLVMDLKITIKDLSPAMFLSMQSALGEFFNTRGSQNDSWIDYMNTMAGIGLSSRSAKIHNLIRNKSTAILRFKNTVLNPEFLGYFVAEQTGVLKSLVRMTPWKDYPESR
jgi:hypothetical protein